MGKSYWWVALGRIVACLSWHKSYLMVTLATINWFYDWTSAQQWLIVGCQLDMWLSARLGSDGCKARIQIDLGNANSWWGMSIDFLLSCTWLDIPQVQQEIHLCILNLYIHTWKWWICHCQICFPESNTRLLEWDGRKKVAPRKPPQTSWNSTFESLISIGTKNTMCSVFKPPCMVKKIYIPDSLLLALFLYKYSYRMN